MENLPRLPYAEYSSYMCVKFHYDRLRNDRALGNRKSGNNKNHKNNNKTRTTFVSTGEWGPFLGLKMAIKIVILSVSGVARGGGGLGGFKPPPLRKVCIFTA